MPASMSPLARACALAWPLLAGAVQLKPAEERPRYALRAAAPDLEAEALNLVGGGAAACVPLKNCQSHYTTEVAIGTPPRKVHLLVDTGSGALLVNSCQCHDVKACGIFDRCFAPHRSRTFNQSHSFKGHAPKAFLTFGSGSVETRLGADVVSVGGVSAELRELHLLTQRSLSIAGPFDGILGLGPPYQPLGNASQPEELPGAHGFLEAAGVERFAICLRRQGTGFLRLGTPAAATPLPSLGKVHWGVSFLGASVGNWRISNFCSPHQALRPGQDSACGALPDSGTTLIAAPKQQLTQLFDHLCEHWPRCNETFQNRTYGTEHKYFHFERLLVDCHDWAGLPGRELNLSQINEELPHLRFTLGGRGGRTQQIKLLGEDYLTHMLSATHLRVVKGLGMKGLGNSVPYQGTQRKVCAPAFHPTDMNSTNMGPVWILGLPVLHKYQVHYDRGAWPPTVAFSSEPCDSCEEAKLASGAGAHAERRQNGLLWLDRAPRISPFVGDVV